MGRYLSIAILGLAAALSASFLPQLIAFFVALLGNFSPLLNHTRGQLSLVLLLVLCWSMRASLLDSLLWALVGGLMLDMLSMLPLGATSIALLLIAFLINSAARQLLRLRIVFLLAITPVATIFLFVYSYLALALLGHSYDALSVIRLVLLPTMLYNFIAVLPIYAFTRWLQRRLEGGLQIAPQSLAQGAEMGLQE